jgi:hypothetical protein
MGGNSVAKLTSKHIHLVRFFQRNAIGKQKGQKKQKDLEFCLFVLFALFVSSAPFAMEPDIKNTS